MRSKSAICIVIFAVCFAIQLFGREKPVVETQFFSLETELSDPVIQEIFEKVTAAIDGKIFMLDDNSNIVEQALKGKVGSISKWPARKFTKFLDAKAVKPEDMVLVVTVNHSDGDGIYHALVRGCVYEYGKRRYVTRSAYEFRNSVTGKPDDVKLMENKIMHWLKGYAFK